MEVEVSRESLRLAGTFTISRGSRTTAEVLLVTLRSGGVLGRGECVPYARYGESPDSVANQIRSLPDDFDRDELQALLPPGAARNAVDCALWDLQARQSGKRAWELAGLSPPGPVQTAYTLSLDGPEAMEAQARTNAHRPLLKVKLGAKGDLERIKAVRQGAPDSMIIIDANEGWSVDDYNEIVPHLQRLGIGMIEQPLPAGQDDALANLGRQIPVCADESCHDSASLPELTGKYDVINIKLDKAGGLTEALKLRSAALEAGLQVMVGCMLGSSLAMAPAMMLTEGAMVVDLDGPLLLAEDRDPPLSFDAKGIHPPPAALWG